MLSLASERQSAHGFLEPTKFRLHTVGKVFATDVGHLEISEGEVFGECGFRELLLVMEGCVLGGLMESVKIWSVAISG